jgi:hypothetical protein
VLGIGWWLREDSQLERTWQLKMRRQMPACMIRFLAQSGDWAPQSPRPQDDAKLRRSGAP